MAPCHGDEPAFLAVATDFPALPLPRDTWEGPHEMVSAGTSGGVLPRHTMAASELKHMRQVWETVGSLCQPVLFQVNLLDCCLHAWHSPAFGAGIGEVLSLGSAEKFGHWRI